MSGVVIAKSKSRSQSHHSDGERDNGLADHSGMYAVLPGAQFAYYPGRRLVPAPLRAFVDFIKPVAIDRKREAPGASGGAAKS
jgi:hypothetical protein